MTIQSKLNRLKKHMGHVVSSDSTTKEQKPIPPARQVAHEEYWTKFQATPYFYEEDHCIIREVCYPADHKWGLYRFSDLYTAVEKWNQIKSKLPLAANNLKASELLFFDTETTGLSGGAGNTIFMLGSSRLVDDLVQINQYFLPEPGSEIALYHYFLNHVHELKNLVTYNGKSFDWPQVKTRHTMIRDYVPSLPAFGHFDLLHGARRMWKNDLPSVKLSIVEKEIIGVNREHDTPGYLAPMLYFQYLNHQDPALLEGVFRHNEWDVLSLITLYIHLSSLLQGTVSCSAREQYESARWMEAVGENDAALDAYQKVIYTDSTFVVEAKKASASLLKKQKRWREACLIWEDIATAINDEDAHIELAKYHERYTKDLEKALYHAQEAFASWKQKVRIMKHKAEQEKMAILARIERLENKRKK